EHHYGHGKVESLSALAETALLFVLSGVVIWEAGLRLVGVENQPVEATIAAFAVMTVSILVDFARSRALYRAAAKHKSEALEADGRRVRARKVGPRLFVDLDIAASRTLPLDRVMALKAEIERALAKAMPETELNAVVTPRALDDETVLERVMVIARNRALAVHHVTVQAIAERLSVSLDLEVDGALPLGGAHEIADGLEQAVREELGPEVEVETHIEPLQLRGLAGRDAVSERI